MEALETLSRRGRWLALGLVVIAAVAVYANALQNGFVFDDGIIILNNPYIRRLRHPSVIFLSGYWPDPRMDLLYRPLVIASYAVNYAIGGFTPWGYHLVNIILHAATSGLVYALTSRLFRSKLLAFLSAIGFALHPIHTEAVANVVGRAELLAAFFFCLAWMAYLRAQEALGRKRFAFLASSLICFGLALISKEHAVVLLGALVLSDLLRHMQHHPRQTLQELGRQVARPLWTIYPWYVATFGLYVWIRLQVLGALRTPVSVVAFIDNPIANADLPTRLLTATKILGQYLWLLLVPYRLSADYSYNAIPLSRTIWEPAVLLTLLALLLMAALAWMARRRQPVFAFALVFFGVSILPVSNLLFPIGTIMGERLMYLPSLAFCLAFGAVVEIALLRATVRSKALAALSLALFVGVCAVYSVRTVLRNRDWRDNFTLWSKTVQTSPQSAMAHAALGEYLRRRGQQAEGEREFQTALGINPNDFRGHVGMGALLASQGKWAEAERELLTAVRLKPAYPFCHLELGRLYQLQGRWAEAEEALKKAVWLNPTFDEAHLNLGVVYLNQGRFVDAEKEVRTALESNPRLPDAHLALGRVALQAGRTDEALGHFQAEIGLNGDNAFAHNNLGVLYAQRAQVEQALEEFQAALRIDPDFAEARANLARLYLRLGKAAEAERLRQEGPRRRPDDSKSR